MWQIFFHNKALVSSPGNHYTCAQHQVDAWSTECKSCHFRRCWVDEESSGYFYLSQCWHRVKRYGPRQRKWSMLQSMNCMYVPLDTRAYAAGTFMWCIFLHQISAEDIVYDIGAGDGRFIVCDNFCHWCIHDNRFCCCYRNRSHVAGERGPHASE